MEKRSRYSNPFRELLVDGVAGYPLCDFNPDQGVFASTPALSKGEQLHNLYTKTRNSYNVLLARLDKSGFHSAQDDLVKAAYDRTGEGRIKDASLFYFYLTVRETDLKFLDSTLQNDENGDEIVTESWRLP